MRIHQWLSSALFTLLVLTITSSLNAQDPYLTVGNHLLDEGGLAMPGQSYGGGMPAQSYGGGMPGQTMNIPASSGQYIPQNSALSTAPMGQASFQEGMNPWPKVSPFENIWSQHRIDDGLWVNETSNLGYKYHFSFDAMLTTIRPPERTRVGEEAIDEFNHTFENPDVFPVTDTRNIYDSKRTGGILGKWGVDQDDGQGLEISGFYIPSVDNVKHIGTRNGDPTFSGDINLFNPGIPINTDLVWTSGLEGERELRFDIEQRYSYSHEAWGTNASWFMSPIYKKGNIRVRPLLGVRYLGIKERLKFEGVDSGDLYTLIFEGATEGGDDTGAGDGSTTDSTSRAATVGEIVFNGPEQFATLTSMTQTHLVGPEIGLDYVLGGKKFQFNGSTRIGLLGNFEKLKVKGKGFGGLFSIRDTDEDSGATDGENTYPVLIDPNYDPDHVFNNNKTHSHVSPVFSQDINMEIAILDMIPFIKSKSLFDNAVFKVGYSVVVATEIARPESIIVWNDQRQDPQVDSNNRTNWWAQAITLGMEWRY